MTSTEKPLTLREALATGRLDEFVKQHEKELREQNPDCDFEELLRRMVKGAKSDQRGG